MSKYGKKSFGINYDRKEALKIISNYKTNRHGRSEN